MRVICLGICTVILLTGCGANEEEPYFSSAPLDSDPVLEVASPGNTLAIGKGEVMPNFSVVFYGTNDSPVLAFDLSGELIEIHYTNMTEAGAVFCDWLEQYINKEFKRIK